jgi:hypothetical protein
LAGLYADLSTAGCRLSIVVADHRGACVDVPAWCRTAPVGLVPAVLVDGCAALDRVAELPALARERARRANRSGADLVAQADAVASVAAHLAIVLRGEGTGFRGDLPARSGLAGLAGFGPNETDESLILAAENVSQALSLAARLVLVLAPLRARRRRARQLAVLRRRGPATRVARWVARATSLPLATGVAYVWPITGAHPAAVAVAAALAVVAVSVGRRARPRIVGPLGAVLGLLSDLVGLVTSGLLPHAVLLVLAVVDLVTGIRAAGPRRPAERGEAGCTGFTNGHPRPRRARREHRDQ